jgi:predicted DNA-binding WGR domain protein
MFVRLEMVDKVHNKFYEVTTGRQESGLFLSKAKYGRIIGGGDQFNTLYEGPDEEKAILVAQDQVRKKVAKGYRVVQERV